MKINKLLLGLSFFVITVWLTSCLNGENSQSYTNTYGYVTTGTDYNTYVRTSSGDAVSWSGISSDVSSGQCITFSYSTDYSIINTYYTAATTHKIQSKMTPIVATSGTPININDSNFVTSTTVKMFSEDEWFGNNYFLALGLKKYKDVTVTPSFYYSLANSSRGTDLDVTDFDASSDSVIVDIRLNVSGSSSTKVQATDTIAYAVNLSNIRTLFNDNGFKDVSIPIYFRFHPSATTKSTSQATMVISE